MERRRAVWLGAAALVAAAGVGALLVWLGPPAAPARVPDRNTIEAREARILAAQRRQREALGAAMQAAPPPDPGPPPFSAQGIQWAREAYRPAPAELPRVLAPSGRALERRDLPPGAYRIRLPSFEADPATRADLRGAGDTE